MFSDTAAKTTMAENFQMFKLEDMLDFILDHNIDQLERITLSDLKKPTSEMVQKIYHFYIMVRSLNIKYCSTNFLTLLNY